MASSLEIPISAAPVVFFEVNGKPEIVIFPLAVPTFVNVTEITTVTKLPIFV